MVRGVWSVVSLVRMTSQRHWTPVPLVWFFTVYVNDAYRRLLHTFFVHNANTYNLQDTSIRSFSRMKKKIQWGSSDTKDESETVKTRKASCGIADRKRVPEKYLLPLIGILSYRTMMGVTSLFKLFNFNYSNLFLPTFLKKHTQLIQFRRGFYLPVIKFVKTAYS